MKINMMHCLESRCIVAMLTMHPSDQLESLHCFTNLGIADLAGSLNGDEVIPLKRYVCWLMLPHLTVVVSST